jgi:hypothetical protein
MDILPLEIHRFFRNVGQNGIFAILIILARQLLVVQMSDKGPDQWQSMLTRCQELLGAWFYSFDQIVSPPRLIDGVEIQQILQIPEGPQIKQVLLLASEMQVEQGIRTKSEMLQKLKEKLEAKLPPTSP